MRNREDGGRFRLGLLGLFAFLLLFVVAGMTVVDESAPAERLADGRHISIGVRWPGSPDYCVTDVERIILPNCYRERVALTSFVKQPASAASALAFGLVGLTIFRLVDREIARGASFHFGYPYQTWYGIVALAMGVGSLLFHGTLTVWGGWLDQVSMYLLLVFMISYNLITWLGWGIVSFALLYGFLVSIAGALSVVAGAIGIYAFMGVAVVVGLFELGTYLLLPRARGIQRSGPRLALTFGVLGLSLVPWFASHPKVGGPPSSIPFHLFWHVLAALFVGSYFMYLRSETPL